MDKEDFVTKVKPLDKDFPYRFATYYRLNDPHEPYVSEYNLFFDESVNKASNLVGFIKQYQDRNINIKCTSDSQETIEQVCSLFDNVRIRLDVTNLGRVDYLRKNNINFFFDSSLPANSYTQLEALLDMGVCAVYVSDDLANNIQEVHEICADHGVQVRCILNKVPSTSLEITYKDIVYDPRLIDEYKKVYDVFEFDISPNVEESKHLLNVLFRVFFEQKKWAGDLREINEDIPFSYDLRTISDKIAEYKNTCQRRCMMRSTSQCHRCEKIIKDRSEILKEKNWKVVDNG